MNTYQKLATFILRLVGVCWTFFLTLAWLAYAIEAASGVDVQHYPMHTIVGNIGYITIGFLTVFASRPLGRFIGRGLD